MISDANKLAVVGLKRFVVAEQPPKMKLGVIVENPRPLRIDLIARRG